jgi:tetratricopeptide (TPR) repeat protein
MSRQDAPDKLLKELLGLAQQRDLPSPETHPDEETLALLALGQLSQDARSSTMTHVADCDLCRQAVAEVLKAESHVEETSAAPLTALPARPVAIKTAMRYWPIAVAAGLMLLISATAVINPLLRGRREDAAYAQALAHLEEGRYQDARIVLEKGLARDPGSPRLASLLAQSHRQMPAALALAHAGRLSDFGVEIGGIVARDPAQWPHREGLGAAESALKAAREDEPEVLLNQAHLLLSRGDVESASERLAAAQKLAPEHPLVWLGLGLVAFLKDDLPAAERAFRRSIELAPDNTAAKINLAMTLQEQGEASGAVAAWQEVLRQTDLSAAERARIEQEVKVLQEAL